MGQSIPTSYTSSRQKSWALAEPMPAMHFIANAHAALSAEVRSLLTATEGRHSPPALISRREPFEAWMDDAEIRADLDEPSLTHREAKLVRRLLGR